MQIFHSFDEVALAKDYVYLFVLFDLHCVNLWCAHFFL